MNGSNKSAEMSRSEQRLLVVRWHDEFTIGEQCALLGLSCSTLYYKPKPAGEENQRIMRLMDELHLEDPARGTRRLCDELVDLGIRVGRDKVRTLMRRMRMACVCRRPRTTVLDKANYKHPYLPSGLEDGARAPSVGDRHHLHPHEGRVHVHVRDHRPVQSLHSGLEHL